MADPLLFLLRSGIVSGNIFLKNKCNYVAILVSCISLNYRPLILRVTAFFLLLVFSQKIGVGLLLHNLFHDNTVSNITFDQKYQEGKGTSNTCSCVDDLLMPFIETAETAFSKPLIIFTEQAAFIEENTSFFKPVLSLLRGPPASNV